MSPEQKAFVRALMRVKPKPRCPLCGSTVGRHLWTDFGGQCPEKFQPGIISGIPSRYWGFE